MSLTATFSGMGSVVVVAEPFADAAVVVVVGAGLVDDVELEWVEGWVPPADEVVADADEELLEPEPAFTTRTTTAIKMTTAAPAPTRMRFRPVMDCLLKAFRAGRARGQ